jgi:hypothetical protein
VLPTNQPRTLTEAIRYYSDVQTCINAVALMRWQDGIAVARSKQLKAPQEARPAQLSFGAGSPAPARKLRDMHRQGPSCRTPEGPITQLFRSQPQWPLAARYRVSFVAFHPTLRESTPLKISVFHPTKAIP